MKIKSIIAAAAILSSTISMAQVMVKNYTFDDPSTGGNETNFNFVTDQFDTDYIISGSTEDRGGNLDFHLTLRDLNGVIIWDRLYDFGPEDHLSSVVTTKGNEISVVGTYLNGGLMRGKVLIIDGNSGNLLNQTDVYEPGRDTYLLGSDFSNSSADIAVCGFVADPNGNMLTAQKDSYVANLNSSLNLNWSNSYTSNTSGNEVYNMFSKVKFVNINGVEQIYLTGSQSYPEPNYAETQAVSNILLDTGGGTVWDNPFIATFPGHWTFGVDVIENTNTNELILLCQETETHESFIAQLDNSGAIMAGHHYYISPNMNNFGCDLEWINMGQTFAVAGYQNHNSNNYKAYMMEVDANLVGGLTVYNKEYLKHNLYNYGSATGNVVYKPYTALGAIRPFIYNPEMVTRHSSNSHLYLLTGENTSTVGSVINTKLWRTPAIGTNSDCTDPMTITDSKLFYTQVNPLDQLGNGTTLDQPNLMDLNQNYSQAMYCGYEFGKLSMEQASLEVAYIQEGLYLENDGSLQNLRVSISDIMGREVSRLEVELQDEKVISLDGLNENSIYFIEVTDLNTGQQERLSISK